MALLDEYATKNALLAKHTDLRARQMIGHHLTPKGMVAGAPGAPRQEASRKASRESRILLRVAHTELQTESLAVVRH